MKKLLSSLLIVTFIGVGACSEDEPSIKNLFKVSNSGCKLKRVIESLDPVDYDVLSYEYDTQGRLISELQEFVDTSYTTLYYYNEKDQLTKKVFYAGTDYDYYHQITWKNDLPFQIDQVYEGEVIGTRELTFNSHGLVTILEEEQGITHEFHFAFQNGNLHKWYDGDELRVTYFKYDSKHNPYRNMVSALFSWANFFSKNNVTQAAFFGNTPSDVSYTYNKSGYPISTNSGLVYEYVDCK